MSYLEIPQVPDVPGEFGIILGSVEPEEKTQTKRDQGIEVACMRILLADDQPKVLFALRVLLERQPDVQVVGAVTTVEELLTQIQETCPDLLLLGWELPDLATIGSLPALHQVCPKMFVVVLSGRWEARQAAVAAGADAFVSKADPPERLLATIQEGWYRQDRYQV
jgi:DNA-binding NarL/FixJ family response regulator